MVDFSDRYEKWEGVNDERERQRERKCFGLMWNEFVCTMCFHEIIFYGS